MATRGRNKEAKLIRDSNAAAAVGRLLLGEVSSWEEFLEVDAIDYTDLPRRKLRSGKYDIQTNLKHRLDSFCRTNLPKMTRTKLVSLYEELKAHRRLELTYAEFCNRYSPIRNFYENGYPEYSTVCLSLWGLQYRFPEHDFSNDMIVALRQMTESDSALETHRVLGHEALKAQRDTIAGLIRKNESAKRQVMQTSFSILECYLNGLAWEFKEKNDLTELSKNKKALLEDSANVSLREKIRKYPTIVLGQQLNETYYSFLLDEAKQYRDSLMHPSPFSAPEKYGGYDKLQKLYNLGKL